MNKTYIMQSLKVLMLTIISSTILGKPQETNDIDGIAAIVGDQIILKSDVAQLLQLTAIDMKLDPRLDMDKLLLLKDHILNNLINQKIILEIAEVESIVVKEAEVDRALDQQIASMEERLGSEERIEQVFGKTINNIRREYWTEIQNQLISERFQNSLIADISVTREEVIEFYNQYKDSLGSFPEMYNMSHIVLPVTPGKTSREEAYRKILSLRKKIIDKTASFDEVARTYSNDPGSAKNGGELGLVGRGTFVPKFEEVAFTLKEGEISDVVYTEFGYHIIELIEKIGEKINIRHVLITPNVSEADEDSVYKFASMLHDSIISGVDFSYIAKKYTADEKSRQTGGNLGWVDPKSFLVPEIPQILPSLEIGVISPPIRASDGYHLILIHDFKKAGIPTLETHWSEIENIALTKKQSDFFNNWIKRSKSSVFIKIVE